MSRLGKIMDFMEKNEAILCKTEDSSVGPLLALLYDRLKNPRNFIVMAGETSSGKSTLVNSLCGSYILPYSPTPTSGTVVQLEMKKEASEVSYFKYKREQCEEEKISASVFREQAIHPGSDVLRLKVELPVPQREYEGMNVFDTPGFASLVKGHEEVFRDFIPESDIVIFTTTYRNGVDKVSRDFLGLIGEISRRYGELPVLLAVNRCPQGTTVNDKRIMEMISAAEDAFHGTVTPFMINTVELPDDFDGEKPLPETNELWPYAAKLCNTVERTTQMENRAKDVLGKLIRNQLNELEGRLSCMANYSSDEISMLKNKQAKMETFKSRAAEILEYYLGKLEREVPRLLDRETASLLSNIRSEIRQNNKYLNCSACSSFIAGHMAPFGVQKIAGRITDYVADVMEQMDKDLEEMANKAIASIKDQADAYPNPEFSNLLLNLAARLGTKIAGETANNMLRGFGGVGGNAAGMGNLVKMTVSKIGHVFHKTFSRQVYTQIGKFFTKKVMAALSIGLQVFIEAAAFFIEANRWQGRLEKEVEKMLDKWKADVKDEFLNSNIPTYREDNLALFTKIQEDLTEEVKISIQNAEKEYNSTEAVQLRELIDENKTIQTELEAI